MANKIILLFCITLLVICFVQCAPEENKAIHEVGDKGTKISKVTDDSISSGISPREVNNETPNNFRHKREPGHYSGHVHYHQHGHINHELGHGHAHYHYHGHGHHGHQHYDYHVHY